MKNTHKEIILLVMLAIALSATNCTTVKPDEESTSSEKDLSSIKVMLDEFNVAAANADYDKYFNYFTEDAIFIGTDATENWDKKSFMVWAKPYFDDKKTWDFTSIDRHIFFDKTGELAWFDELLDTQMKICRGSGVLVKEGDSWKIKQYVLSITVPNSVLDSVTLLKTTAEDKIIAELSK